MTSTIPGARGRMEGQPPAAHADEGGVHLDTLATGVGLVGGRVVPRAAHGGDRPLVALGTTGAIWASYDPTRTVELPNVGQPHQTAFLEHIPCLIRRAGRVWLALGQRPVRSMRASPIGRRGPPGEARQ
jgi:hypothetical protein